MKKHQNGFSVIETLIVLVVLCLIGFAGWHVLSKNKASTTNNTQVSHGASSSSGIQEGSGPNYKSLSQCGNKDVLSAVPVNTSDFYQIVPLGNIGVPDHTLPTSHVYFAIKDVNGPSPQLKSPGKIVVINILYAGSKINGVSSHPDGYQLIFYACKGVSFNFAHVQTLTGKLAEAVKGENWDKPCDRHTPAAGEETFYCSKTTDIMLQPDELIGTVGGNPQLGAFDFQANSTSYKDPGIINAKWYPTINAVCPLDYFQSAAKAQLMTLVKRTIEPRCGQIGQDKANTAQGSWFATQDTKQGFNDWNMGLALVHDNINPNVGIVAIGGTISSPMIIKYNPVHSGSINREPSEIKAGGVYCFQNESTSALNNQPASGKALVQLVDNTTLKVEHQTGSCGGSEAFSAPTTYYR